MKIIQKDQLAPTIVRFVVNAAHIAAKAEPGHFVIVRHKEMGERIPLTIADFDRDAGTITLVCQGIGHSTGEINELTTGDSFLDILGPLGEPYPVKKLGTVVCVAGGLGVAPLYPKAKALAAAGNKVITLMGAQTKDMLIMTAEMEAISERVEYSTDDGSLGYKGFVTKLLQDVLETEAVDEVVVIGPLPMMAAAMDVTRPFGVPSIVSLNTLMVDGTGMCGGCRVTVDGQTKFACVDGPAFDGHAVNFKEILQRQPFYKDQERKALHTCRLEEVI